MISCISILINTNSPIMSFIKNLIHNHDIQNNDQLQSFIKHQKLSQVDEITPNNNDMLYKLLFLLLLKSKY